MKMPRYFIALFLLAPVVQGCHETYTGEGPVVVMDRKTGEVHKVAVNMSADVIITDTTVSFCKVHAQENIQEAITTNMDGGVLYISSKGTLITSEPVVVEVGMVRPEGVEVNGSATVKAANTLKNEKLSFEVNGSGSLQADVVSLKTRAYVSGSGVLDISGSTRQLTADISGSGEIKAFRLTSLEAKADISGSGKAEVLVSESLNAKVGGSGEIHYKGNPKVEQSVSGSGSVTRVE